MVKVTPLDHHWCNTQTTWLSDLIFPSTRNNRRTTLWCCTVTHPSWTPKARCWSLEGEATASPSAHISTRHPSHWASTMTPLVSTDNLQRSWLYRLSFNFWWRLERVLTVLNHYGLPVLIHLCWIPLLIVYTGSSFGLPLLVVFVD